MHEKEEYRKQNPVVCSGRRNGPLIPGGAGHGPGGGSRSSDSLAAHYTFDEDFSDSVSGSAGQQVNANAPTIVTDDMRGE